MREAKIRLVQACLLACTGVYALPVELRIYGLVGTAVANILAGVVVFISLSRHLGQKLLAFDQSITELKKDRTCFSTRN